MPCRAWKPWLWRAASICATRSPRPTTNPAGLTPPKKKTLPPAPANRGGGLGPGEERPRGAWARAGKSPLVGVLSYGQAPARKGLHFMDAPSGAVENLTGLAAGGCQLICFGTGVGNPIGNMVAPTIKICGNVNTVHSMRDNIDFDVSAIFESSA